MKVKVIKKFIDAKTKQLHTVGEELEVTKERYAEICKVSKSLVEVVEETAKKSSTKKGDTE